MRYPVFGHDYHGYPPHPTPAYWPARQQAILDALQKEVQRQAVTKDGNYLCFATEALVVLDGVYNLRLMSECIYKAMLEFNKTQEEQPDVAVQEEG